MDIRLTSDGSFTVFSEKFQETYHSINGAVTESKHVFISAGLGVCPKQKISVLEVGFGTGLNALLACKEAQSKELEIEYHSIELYPLDLAFLGYLGGTGLNSDDMLLMKQLHEAPWEENVAICNGFLLYKERADLLEFVPNISYDVVFFDAFSPVVQPELWDAQIFRKLFESMAPGGILVTYCAKGQVRRNMVVAGFVVERLSGPPGKREMLRAKKS